MGLMSWLELHVQLYTYIVHGTAIFALEHSYNTNTYRRYGVQTKMKCQYTTSAHRCSRNTCSRNTLWLCLIPYLPITYPCMFASYCSQIDVFFGHNVLHFFFHYMLQSVRVAV